MSRSIQPDNVASVKRWDTTRWKELTLSEHCLEDKALMFTVSHENHCRSLYWELQESYSKSAALSYVSYQFLLKDSVANGWEI
jgi:hypothetical protein